MGPPRTTEPSPRPWIGAIAAFLANNDIIGQTLWESATVRHSPWFAQGGDGAVFTCETIAVRSASVILGITVKTKNRNEPDGDETTAVGFMNISAVGRSSATATALKELVRYEYLVSSDPPSNFEWVHFRMLEPRWLRN